MRQTCSALDSVTTKSDSIDSTGGGVPLPQGSLRGGAFVQGSAAPRARRWAWRRHHDARFAHVMTADGHAVITGRKGDTLRRCEDEPIHIPGVKTG